MFFCGSVLRVLLVAFVCGLETRGWACRCHAAALSRDGLLPFSGASIARARAGKPDPADEAQGAGAARSLVPPGVGGNRASAATRIRLGPGKAVQSTRFLEDFPKPTGILFNSTPSDSAPTSAIASSVQDQAGEHRSRRAGSQELLKNAVRAFHPAPTRRARHRLLRRPRNCPGVAKKLGHPIAEKVKAQIQQFRLEIDATIARGQGRRPRLFQQPEQPHGDGTRSEDGHLISLTRQFRQSSPDTVDPA